MRAGGNLWIIPVRRPELAEIGYIGNTLPGCDLSFRADQAVIRFGLGVNVTMAKATRATDNATPKKRTRKASAEADGTQVVETVKTPAIASETTVRAVETTFGSAVPEEKIRRRAYEIYLQRGGRGGSPEQDWFQAQKEIAASLS